MAARGINKVILVGNLGQDPETRYTQSGAPVVNISLATNREWTDNSGQKQQETEWHRVVMFGKLAEIAGQYLGKGGQIYVEGRLRTRKWQDQQGNDRYSTEVVANEMQMLGGGGGGGYRSGGGQPAGGGQQGPPQSQGGGQPQGQGGGGAPTPDMDQDFEDDIPFAVADFSTTTVRRWRTKL